MMTSTQRIAAMINHQPFDRCGVAGWVHMPFVDHNVTDMVKATIMVTDYCNWDFVKIMTTGHYVPEAFGGDITLSKDPTHWYGTINRYPVETLDDLRQIPVLTAENPVLAREIEVARLLKQHYQNDKPVLATIFTPMTCLQEMMSRGTTEKTRPLMENHKAEVHQALEKLVQTNINYLKALTEKAHIDGIFFASQYINHHVITDELYDEFCAPYDKQILDYIKDKTWFNILHVHGESQLMFDKCLDYPVQAYSWENCVPGIDPKDVSTVAQVRSMTDKVLITGLARHYDYYNADNNRSELKEFFRSRLKTIITESGDNRVIFAPGCALPMDVDRYVFTLMNEVVQEEGYNHDR
jgi:uroporphyrinogen decarboxylase